MFTLPFPDTNDSTIDVTLDGAAFKLRLSWNDTAARWTLGILDAASSSIVMGVAVNPNTPILERLRAYTVPAGEIVAVSKSGATLTRTSFVDGSAFLQYVTVADLAALRISQGVGTGPVNIIVLPVPYYAAIVSTPVPTPAPSTTTPTPAPAPTPTTTTPTPTPAPSPTTTTTTNANYRTDGTELSPSIAFVTGGSVVSGLNIAGGAMVVLGTSDSSAVTRNAGYLTSSTSDALGAVAFGLMPAQWWHDISTGDSAAIFVEFTPPSGYADGATVMASAVYGEPGFSVGIKSSGAVTITAQCGSPWGSLNWAGVTSASGLITAGAANKMLMILDGAAKAVKCWVNGTRLSDVTLSPTNGDYASNAGHGVAFGASPTSSGVQGATAIEFDAIHVAHITGGNTFRSDLYDVIAANPQEPLASYTDILSSSYVLKQINTPTATPAPSTSTPTTSPAPTTTTTNAKVQLVVADMSTLNDATPYGQTGRKSTSAFIGAGRRNNGDAMPTWWSDYASWAGSGWWSQAQPWFTANLTTNSNVTNNRVSIRNMTFWVLSATKNTWTEVRTIAAGQVWCDWYTSSFANAYSWSSGAQIPVRTASDGSSEIALPLIGQYQLVHGGMGGFLFPVSNGDIANVIVSCEMRIVQDSASGVDNRSSAAVLMNVGIDMFPTMTATRRSFSSNDVPAMGVSRSKWITSSWTRVSFSPLDATPSNWVETALADQSKVLASTSLFMSNPPPFLLT